MQRWRCRTPDCAGGDVDPLAGLRAQLPGRQRRSNLTQRLYDELIDRYQRGTTVQQLSHWSGVQPRTLWRLLEDHRERSLAAPRSVDHWRALTHIGIDELMWRDRVLCVIVSLTTGELLDLLPDRRVSTVVESLEEIRYVVETLTGEPWRPVVATDMWGDYRAAVHQVFQGGAVHVTDRFHLQAKIGEDLISVAREILPASRQRPRQIRAVREAFHVACRSEGSATISLASVIQEQERLEVALRLAVQLQRVWDSRDRPSAEQAYARWRWNVAKQAKDMGVHRPFGRMIYLCEQWKAEIFAYFDQQSSLPDGRRVTGALTESVNSRLRQVERRGYRHSRDHFNVGGDQRHFEAFWCAGMHMINAPLPERTTLWGMYRPFLPQCPCGAEVAPVQWHDTRRVIRNVPLGERPVAYRLQDGAWQCPACQQTGRAVLPPTPQVTVALTEYVQEQRLHGWSVRRLAQVTGLSRPAIARIVTQTGDPVPPAPAPAVLGVQIWRWRRKLHWILTNAESGKLTDIVPVTESSLTVWLSSTWARHVKTCLLALPDWRFLIPAGKILAIDRFTAVLPVQRALREVQRRHTNTLTVAARRQPMWTGHRRIILSAPHQQNRAEQERLSEWLQQCDELRIARRLRDDYLERLASGSSIEKWIQEARQMMAVTPDTPLRRALHYGFRDACSVVEQAAPMIRAGLSLEDVNLASSRRLLRRLREHPASKQPDFETLRRAALHILGPPV